MNCCKQDTFDLIKKYEPKPKNSDGSIRWFLYRWDDGKNGERSLVRCRKCGRYYLVQAYHLNKFSEQKDTLFEDFYAVKDEWDAEHLNKTYTGIQLEHKYKPVFSFTHKE